MSPPLAAPSGMAFTACNGSEWGNAWGDLKERSGVVHPPPSRLLTSVLELTSRVEFHVTEDIRAKLLRLSGSIKRYLRDCNWLELDLPSSGDLLANWRAEGAPDLVHLSILESPDRNSQNGELRGLGP